MTKNFASAHIAVGKKKIMPVSSNGKARARLARDVGSIPATGTIFMIETFIRDGTTYRILSGEDAERAMERNMRDWQRRPMHLTLNQDDAGSIPASRTNGGMAESGLLHPPFKRNIT